VRTSPDGAFRYQAAQYQRLLAAARRSLERTGGELAGSISVSHPTDAERKAIIYQRGGQETVCAEDWRSLLSTALRDHRKL